MDLKQCPNCHQELPKEANFCPYCMTKLIAEDGTEILVKKRNNKKIKYILPIVLLCFLVISACVFIILTLNKKQAKKTSQMQSKAMSKQWSYSDYLGVWFDEKPEGSLDLASYYGKRIEICRVNNDEIVFNLENFSISTQQMAYLEDIKVRLYNGKGSFSFSDDGFGNHGSGDITLSDGKIHVIVDLDRYYTKGTWDLSMDTDFVRVARYDSGQEVDITNFLTSYRRCRALLGNRTDIHTYGNSITYIYDNGLSIDVEDTFNMDELYITDIIINYKNLKSDYKYTFKGIDNHSSKKDVEKILGGTNLEKEKYSYTFYSDTEDRIAEIYFDENDMVKSIDYRNN